MEGYDEEEDLAEALDIVKYEPEVPVHMQGEVCNLRGHTPRYDIESIQKFPGVLRDGEEVVFTEKLHGTWTCFGFHPGLGHPDLLEGGTIITSKGNADTGFAFKWTDANASNLYVMSFRAAMLETGRWDRVRAASERTGEPVYILGETFGKKVQDLDYGQPGGPSGCSTCTSANRGGAGISTTTSCSPASGASGGSRPRPASTGGRSRWRRPSSTGTGRRRSGAATSARGS